MGFAESTGYIPLSIETILDQLRVGFNTQFSTAWTTENFVGSNHYKFAYALAQRIQAGEIKTAEVFQNLQKYFEVTNERIQRPVATNPGLIEAFLREGWVASVKPTIEADAGKLFVAVDVDETGDDYAAEKLEINTIIANSSAAGVVSMGAEVSNIVLSNGQDFDFKFNLPNRIDVKLRLTLTQSDNNQVVIGTPESVKQKLIDNIAAKYRLGRDFEPQRYFTTVDAPWTSQVLLEWSDDDGATWESGIFEADYDDLFDVKLENIILIEE